MLLMGLVSCGGGSGSKGNSEAPKSFEPVSIPEDEGTLETEQFRIITKRKVELKEDFSNIEEFKENINSYVIQFEAKSGRYVDATVECLKSNFIVVMQSLMVVSIELEWLHLLYLMFWPLIHPLLIMYVQLLIKI